MKIKALVVALIASSFLAGSGVAQTSKGILVGVARDATGAVVTNANVTIVGNSDHATRTIATKSDGSYRLEALNPETYTVTVHQPGFEGFTAKNVIVEPSLVITYDINLVVGSAQDTVNVEADSMSINTENGQLAGTIDKTDMAKLPIFSVSPYELATTLPGVQIVDASMTNGSSGFSNGINIQVNGARPRANNFLLDGQEINDVGIGGQAFQPNLPDMYDSLAVLTSSSSAEFGRAGGGVVNLVTKAGTNQFHGEVFERYTGSGLNALGGQERGTTATKARQDAHQYGFTAGGPIIKDKLFAFGGLSLSRVYGQGQFVANELPDAAGYALLQQIGGPQVALLDQYLSNGSYLTTDTQFNNRTTVTTQVGPQGAACPPGGCTITESFFQRPNGTLSNPDTQWTYRIDYKPWDKDSFSARYIHDRTSSNPDFLNNPGALAGFDTLQGGPSELGAGTWTHIFTPNLLNEFRVGEVRLSFAFAPTPQTLANPLNSQETITFDDNSLPALGPNQNFPQGRGEDLYQLQDTVGWTRGRQSLRMGVDIGRQIETDIVSQNALGTLSFISGGTNAAGASYVSALGNFLQNQLGPSGSATKTFGNTRIDPHNWRIGLFGQDDIKINSDLTINLGVRYDYLSNPANSLKFPGLDPNNPTSIVTLNSGVPTANVIKVNNDLNNISPRVGFAFAPHRGGFFADGKSVIRGGFGIFYDSGFSNFVVNAAQASPNAVAGELIQTTGVGLANATSLVPTLTPQLSLLSSVQGVNSNMVAPVTYQYNLGVERQLPANMFVAVRYVGARSNKLFSTQRYNYFSGTTGERLNPNYGAIDSTGNYGESNYNSLQVEASHLFSHGFQIRGNYTYSKDLDDVSEIFATFSAPTALGANLAPGGLGQDYGPSSYDHRHYLAISYVWSPAGFRASNAFANAALGAFTRHWTLSGIETFQAGPYSTFSTAVDFNGDGVAGNDRPIIGTASAPITTAGIDGTFVGGTTGTYYDMAAFNATGALNPVTASNVHWLIPNGLNNQFLHQEIGRNSFANPGLQFHNLALEKGIGLSYLHLERGQLILRAEVQNIGNHNNIGPLDTSVTDIGNGNFLNRKNGTEDPGRNMVLWAKIAF